MLGVPRVPRLPAPSPESPGNNRALGECMFCHDREQNADTGQLLKIPDDSVIAHYNCMLYAPLVVTKSPPDPSVLSGFDVESVKKEISRGEITRCYVCKRKGGIVGCDVPTCKRTYHYLCVKRANGHYVLDEENEIYKVFCSEHGKKKRSKSKVQVERDKDSDDSESGEESTNVKTPDRPFTKRKKRDGQTNSARKKKKKRDEYRDAEFNEYSDSGDLTEPIHTPTFSIEAHDFSGWNSETDDELVSFDGSNITPKQKESKNIASLSSVHLLEEIARSPNACDSSSNSEQGDSFFNPLPKLLHSTSLSRTWAKESAKETECQSVQCITSEEQNVHMEMYDEFGGSLKFQDNSFEDENKSMEDRDIGDNYSSSKEDSFSKEDTSVEQPATSFSASMSPGVPQNPISELPSFPDTQNVVLPESTKSPVLQHTPILKPTDTCEIKNASDAQPKGYRNVRVNLSTKFTSFTQQPGNRALDLRSALPADVKSSPGTQYTNPSSAAIPVAKPTKSDHAKPSVVQTTITPVVVALGEKLTNTPKSPSVGSQTIALMTKHKSEAQMNSMSGVKCYSAEHHARSPAGKGTSQSQPGNSPILKCTPADQKTSFALGKNTLREPLSTYSTNGKVTSVPQSRIIPNLECMVKTFLKEESQSVEVKQLVSKMKEVVNSASKTILLKTPERRDGHHNGKEPPGASTSQTRPENVEAEATSVIMEPGSRQDSRKYKDSSTQTSVAEACADESSLDFSTNNVNLLVQYKTMKSQIFNLGASGIENGAYEKFWNVCRQNNCLEFLLANISCSMKIIVKKIESGQAKEQDYERAFAFLLGSGCLEDVVSKETQEIQARIESIDKKREELSSKIMFLKNLLP